MGEFLDVLERWLDHQIELANKNKRTKIITMAKTDATDKRLELMADLEWLDGYIYAFDELKGYIRRR